MAIAVAVAAAIAIAVAMAVEWQSQFSTWRIAMAVAAVFTETLLNTLEMPHIAHARGQIAQQHWATLWLYSRAASRSPASIIRI
jgi:hypothetical protein